ncbi:hypothetical protein [Paenibacillus wynnii]|uniref:Uncharacterized protein n=1 Tax=Paenibacillus wynnii TaxID=268407 RepID=A0A098MAQ8_9BACL|nr:hypothetical protein [Paenibacillus wynnii]KGE19146.1 hypothetical protein PWYN_07135 [Paenibacillus wynnii]
MISAYAIIITYISVLTFILVFLSKKIFKKSTAAAMNKLIYVVLVLAMVGVLTQLYRGESNPNGLFIYSAVIIIGIILLRSKRNKIKR